MTLLRAAAFLFSSHILPGRQNQKPIPILDCSDKIRKKRRLILQLAPALLHPLASFSHLLSLRLETLLLVQSDSFHQLDFSSEEHF